MSYSQNREESVVLSLIGDTHGKVLDIGAFDGKTFSNSLVLIERGWDAVLVEPGIDSFRKLLDYHGTNAKVTLVHAAIGKERGLVPFWDCGDLYSTTESGNYTKWGKFAAEHGKPFAAPYVVPQVTISDILARCPGPYDVLSIDTEGTSTALFAECMWLMYADPPRIVIVEHDGKEQECATVAGIRYEIVERNAENLVFAKRGNGYR